MTFDPARYGPKVAGILELGGGGLRPMPLAIQGCTSEAARRTLASARASDLFPGSRSAETALSGLWLYFGCFEESHALSQDIHSPEGSFWHGILHRQEPDPGNAGYWFRRVGKHPVFPALLATADRLIESDSVQFRLGPEWDPFAFIDFCEAARLKPGSRDEKVAMDVQLAEWQLLFDYCARADG